MIATPFKRELPSLSDPLNSLAITKGSVQETRESSMLASGYIKIRILSYGAVNAITKVLLRILYAVLGSAVH